MSRHLPAFGHAVFTAIRFCRQSKMLSFFCVQTSSTTPPFFAFRVLLVFFLHPSQNASFGKSEASPDNHERPETLQLLRQGVRFLIAPGQSYFQVTSYPAGSVTKLVSSLVRLRDSVPICHPRLLRIFLEERFPTGRNDMDVLVGTCL